MKHASRYVGLAMALVAAAVLLSACGGSSKTDTAGVSLKPLEPSGTSQEGKAAGSMEGGETASGMLMAPSHAHGSARLTQRGDRLSGTVEISGLAPNSRHAEHLHGPDGACSPSSKMTPNMAVVLPDLVADGSGKAVTRFHFTVHEQVVAPGYFIMVHAKPTPPSQRGQIGSAPASPAFMQALSSDPGILCGDVEADE
jgi:hypothetical protein